MTMHTNRHCECEKKTNNPNDNAYKPSLRACEAIQKKYDGLLRKLAMTKRHACSNEIWFYVIKNVIFAKITII